MRKPNNKTLDNRTPRRPLCGMSVHQLRFQLTLSFLSFFAYYRLGGPWVRLMLT